MKIAQFNDGDSIRPGVIDSGNIHPFDFSGDMSELIQTGLFPEVKNISIPMDQVRLAPPVSRPSKIIAIGLNYKDHADESKGKIPDTPLIFAKFSSSIIGPNDEISWNEAITRKVDFEAELAVVIGKKTFNCSETDAVKAVFGYTCANDVSARDLQFGDGQWVRGKSLDTFCLLGPWIVTPDEVPDPHILSIQFRLNGRLMQDSNTRHMVFKVPALIAFFSKHFTLYPGDIILTGTPHGVGAFREPSIYMNHGDEVEVFIEGIGRLRNRCRIRGR